MKNIFVALILVVLLTGLASAGIVATIGMQGLSFVNPQLGGMISTAVSVYSCVTSAGLVGCGSLIVQNKVVEAIYGEALQAIAEVSPEAAKAIITYNQVKSYIDQGAEIIKEFKLDENGNPTEWGMDFNEEEYAIGNWVGNLSAEDVITSNARYDSETRNLIIKENGFLKIKIKDEEGNVIQELVYKNIRKGGVFKLDENGQVEEASIVSSEDGSIYKFGDNDAIKVGADTKVVYKDGVVKIIGRDKNFLYGNLNITLNKDYVDLFRNKVNCVNCEVDGIKLSGVRAGVASLSIEKKGYFLERGVADYKKIRLTAENERGSVLIGNLDEDLSSYDKNWVKIKDGGLEINSVLKKQINLEVLPGNELLNTFQFQVKRDDEGEFVLDESGGLIPEIVPDNRDNLKFEISNGDDLKIIGREDQNKIPLVIHNPSESGSTIIENGRLSFRIEGGEFKIGVPKTIEESLLIEEAKFESVAFQLKTSSLKDHELRINSGNMYEILSPDQVESPITFNSKGFRLSDSIDDNLYTQTLDYLRTKYPDIVFYVSSKEGGIYKEPSPQVIQLLDQWFAEDLKRTEFFEEVAFTEVFNSAAGYKYLMLGEGAYDLYATKQIRDVNNPLQILTHEFEHEMDWHITFDEEERLKEFERTDKTARELSRATKQQNNLQNIYYSVENYHKPNPSEGLFSGLVPEEKREEYEEYMKLPLIERNKVDILKYQKEIEKLRGELYSSLSKSSEVENVKSKLEKVASMGERRQELYDLIFNPNTEKLSFKEADPYLEEIASLTTEIDTELEYIKYDLEKTGYGKEVTSPIIGMQNLYFFLDRKPTMGIEARVDWHGEDLWVRSHYQKKKNSLLDEVPYLKEQFEKYLASNPKTKKLEHIYSEISIDTSYDIIHDDKMKLIRNRAAGELKQKLVTDYNVDFWEIREKYINEKRRNYPIPKEEFLALSMEDQELILIHDASFDLMLDTEHYEEGKGLVADPELDFLSELAFSLSRLRDDKVQKYTKEATKERFSDEGGIPPLRQMFELEFLLKSERLEDNPWFEQLSTELKNLYEVDHGLPASYGFHNYGNSEKKYSGRYSEIASTYREQPIEVRRFKIHQGTPGQKSLFKKLTQIAFDAGKMDVEEYTQLMGQDNDGDDMGDLFCQSEDCIEYRCVEYKFLCCLQHPNSPNC